MKRRFLRSLSLAMPCLLAFGALAAGQDEIVLVSKGATRYAIVTADDADAARTGKAARLLSKVVKQATGVEMKIVKESQAPKDAPAIYLGMTQAARRAGLPVDKVTGWAYLIRVVGEDVFLVGSDGVYPVQDRGAIDHNGTLKATVAFVERHAGARFIMPGENGTFVPRADKLAVDRKMDVFWSPPFEYVIGRSPVDEVYGVSLNTFGRSPVLMTYGGHSYYDAVPAEKYGKTHPEYFALFGDKRESKGNHLCIAHPDVRRLMIEEMERQLDKGYEWVELAQTDGFQPCQCAECRAIHSDPGERTWIFHRGLAEEMLKRRPGKKLMMISYPPTVDPPRTFTKFPPNVVVQMCRYTQDAFETWAPYDVDKTVYIYNWGTYMTSGFGPKRTPRYAVEQIRLFLKNRVRGIYICGGLRGGQGAYSWDGPSYYAWGKAMDNPDADPAQLLDEYVNAAFEEAAAPMRAYYKAMFARLEAYQAFDRPNGYETKAQATFGLPEDFYCHFFPAKLTADMASNLERAKGLAKQERVKAHLRLVETEFDFVRDLAACYQLSRAYRVEPSWTALDLLAKAIDARTRGVERMFPDGKPARIPGLPSPFDGAPLKPVMEGGRKILATATAPFNWNFTLLRERKVLPGTISKRMVALRAAAAKLDGVLDESHWAAGPWEEMGEVGMGALKNETKFKARYDGEAFYLGFECQFDEVEPIERVQAVGRDGSQAFAQECVEVVLDPFGEREKYYHMIFNPVPDSRYDSRFGFIDDPLHPLYGKRDASWTGDWAYAAVVDKGRKVWTAEMRIPYRVLGVDPPRPGVTWTMNAGREEYPKPKDKGQEAVLSIWSPNLENRSFHDRNTFGDVVFE